MLLPSKVCSYNESILSKFPILLKELKEKPHTVKDLYLKTSENLSFDICEFIEILDCLYALEKIEYDKEMEVLKYVI